MKKILLIAALMLVSTAVQAQSRPQGHISVTGKSMREVTPDRIFVRIVVSEFQLKSKVSVEDVEKNMIRSLKSAGIDAEKRLKIDRVSSYAVSKGKPRTLAFYEIELTSTTELGQLNHALDGEPGISMSVARTDHSQREQIMNELRIEALRNARISATELAAVEGLTISSVRDISVQDGAYYEPQTFTGAAVSMGRRGAEAEIPYATPLQINDIKLSAGVSVHYELMSE